MGTLSQLVGNYSRQDNSNSDRITTRSPGSGDASVGRYNARLGQSSDRRGHTTPVQRQGYPSG